MPVKDQVLALLAALFHEGQVLWYLRPVRVEAVRCIFNSMNLLGAVRSPGGSERDRL